MLRNSTERFKAQYQGSQDLKSYKSLAVTPTKHLQMSATRLKTTQQLQTRTPSSRLHHKKTESQNFNFTTPTFKLNIKDDKGSSQNAERGLKKVALRKEMKENRELVMESAPVSPTKRSRVEWGETRRTNDLIKDPDNFIDNL